MEHLILLFLLQESIQKAEKETLEEAMTTNQDRHFMDVAAECKVSDQALLSLLGDIDVSSTIGDPAATGCNVFELLPSASIHRLGLGFSDLTLCTR